MHFNFVASDKFDINVFTDVDCFINHFPDFQLIWLTNEKELKLLLELINISLPVALKLNSNDFSKYWDISDFCFPEFDAPQFDIFFEKWIEKSNRDYNMDEYGQLICLLGMSSKWNKLKYRLIIR